MVVIKGNVARVTKEYRLTRSEIELLRLLDDTLENITIAMYGNIKYKERVYQIISRLRNKGIEIENRKGIGYKAKEIKWIK